MMKTHKGLKCRRKLLSFSAMGAVMAAVLVVFGMPLQAQDPLWPTPSTPKLTFEVASIKLNKSSDPPHWNMPLGSGDFMRPVGGLFQVSNMPLAQYIVFAYKLTGNMQYLMSGLPGWVNMEHFDIEARAAGTPKKDEFRLMMQSLLAERFKLTMHRDRRQMPVFALVLSKPGKTEPQVTPHTDDTACAPNPNGQQPFPSTTAVPLPPLFCGAISGLQPSAPGRIRDGGRKVPMQLIASAFSGAENFDRPIVNRTGLAGTFDFWFEWAPQFNGDPPPGFQLDPNGPTLQEALQEQLGLKLESATAPVDVMVVDHIEEPSAN
jgi:uncharacterized protein (TIGR03435 family)